MKAIIVPNQPQLIADDKINYSGSVFCSGQHTPESGGASWSVDVPMTSAVAVVNTAMKDAALAALAVQEINTALIDEVIIPGGAVLA